MSKPSSNVSTRSTKSELVPPGEFKQVYKRKDARSVSQSNPEGALEEKGALYASVHSGGLGCHAAVERSGNREAQDPQDKDRAPQRRIGTLSWFASPRETISRRQRIVWINPAAVARDNQEARVPPVARVGPLPVSFRKPARINTQEECASVGVTKR
jgi:hypothetical protein